MPRGERPLLRLSRSGRRCRYSSSCCGHLSSLCFCLGSSSGLLLLPDAAGLVRPHGRNDATRHAQQQRDKRRHEDARDGALLRCEARRPRVVRCDARHRAGAGRARPRARGPRQRSRKRSAEPRAGVDAGEGSRAAVAAAAARHSDQHRSRRTEACALRSHAGKHSRDTGEQGGRGRAVRRRVRDARRHVCECVGQQPRGRT